MYPQVLCVPFGYDLLAGKLIENPHEQKVIAFMQLWREEDNLSYDQIAIKLNSINEPTKRDKIWIGATINKILQREMEYESKRVISTA